MRLQPSPVREHPALARLHRQLVASAVSVIVVRGWPRSGSRWLCDGLARVLSAREVETAQLLGDEIQADEPVEWLRVSGATSDETWRRIDAWTTDGHAAKLLIGVPVPARVVLANAVVLDPSALFLDAEEIVGWLRRGGHQTTPDDVVDWLLWWSEGWLGALDCLDLPLRGCPLTVTRLATASESALAAIVSSLPNEDARTLETIAGAGSLPLATWRQAQAEVEQDVRVGDHGFDQVVHRWFPSHTPTDSLSLPLALHQAVLVRETTRTDSAGHRRWFRELGKASAYSGDRAAAIRLRRLGGKPAESDGALTRRSRVDRQKPVILLRLLGHPQAERVDCTDHRQAISWRLRRAFQSVAYLALAPEHQATRADLVEALWSGADPGTIRKNFHPVLSDARRTLRAAFTDPGTPIRGIVHSQGVYCLDPEIDWRSDVEIFERDATTEATDEPESEVPLARWLAAWRMYRGPLLAGWDETWISSFRDRFARQYLGLLRHVGAACAAAGRSTEALDAYRTALLEDPYDELVHRAVMRLYGAQGRRDLVLVQFLRLQDHLKELNVEPRAETQQCYDQLMRAVPATGAESSRP